MSAPVDARRVVAGSEGWLRCARCGAEKVARTFPRDFRIPDGRGTVCLGCGGKDGCERCGGPTGGRRRCTPCQRALRATEASRG